MHVFVGPYLHSEGLECIGGAFLMAVCYDSQTSWYVSLVKLRGFSLQAACAGNPAGRLPAVGHGPRAEAKVASDQVLSTEQMTRSSGTSILEQVPSVILLIASKGPQRVFASEKEPGN